MRPADAFFVDAHVRAAGAAEDVLPVLQAEDFAVRKPEHCEYFGRLREVEKGDESRRQNENGDDRKDNATEPGVYGGKPGICVQYLFYHVTKSAHSPLHI